MDGYEDKKIVERREVIAPGSAPNCAQHRERLWLNAEADETRNNPQPAIC